MLMHSVFFWLDKDADPALAARFQEGLAKLITIPGTKSAHFGKPSKTEARDVVDSSYDWALFEVFESMDAHDSYQAHPIHAEFVETFAPIWKKVQVYDADI